jgi:GNAT superfamily N-acetyltransferase
MPPDVPALVPVEIRLLGPGDGSVLTRVAPDVFDHPVAPRWSTEFLSDPRHHLAVALDGDIVVGMASAVHYVHPDKAPQLWINEVGVAPTHQGRGVGRQILEALLARGRALGCTEAWVLTDEANMAARRLYAAAGGVATGTLMYTFRLGAEDSSGHYDEGSTG